MNCFHISTSISFVDFFGDENETLSFPLRMGWHEVLDSLFLAIPKGAIFQDKIGFFVANVLLTIQYCVWSSMHSIPKENKVIVWIRRFLFTQSKPLSLSQKFWPWAWRPSPFVAIREDQMKTRWETSSSCAVEPREARANYHFEYRSPRINSVERLCCGILDGHQGRTQRCAGRLSRRCHSQGVVGSQHRFWKLQQILQSIAGGLKLTLKDGVST